MVHLVRYSQDFISQTEVCFIVLSLSTLALPAYSKLHRSTLMLAASAFIPYKNKMKEGLQSF